MSRKLRKEGWPIPDRVKEFAAWAADENKKVANEKDDFLFAHQRFCRFYLQNEGPHRGLVCMHGLGSGKSCSAIATAEALRQASLDRPRTIYVMLPASIRNNYIREIRLCGGKMYRESQSWRLGSVEEVDEAWSAYASSEESIWIADEAGRPFDNLSSSEKESVRKQIDKMIVDTHRFVHYNGITAKALRELIRPGEPNPFDDAVIIVDEIHNFTSNLHGGKMVASLYQRIYEARRCKVMLLSGTPLVNEPNELASLVNLAAGPVYTLEVPLGNEGITKEHEAALFACPHVREFSEDVRKNPVRKVACIRTPPEGFVKVDDARVIRSDHATSKDQREAILEALGFDVSHPGVREVASELLPSDPEEFRAKFIHRAVDDRDGSTDELIDPTGLAKRILGTVSFFKGHDESLYPSLKSISFMYEPMSPRQFSEYTSVRVVEKAREDKAKRFAAMRKGKESDSGVGMRPFSRATCTFVFPESVVRPRRGDIVLKGADEKVERQEASEEHSQEASEAADEETVDKVYDRAMDEAIQKLRDLNPEVMRCSAKGGRLSELSPKFDAIAKKLIEQKGKGTSIVYSQFRRAEGVAILAVALEASGFLELDVIHEDNALRCVLCRGGVPLTSEELNKKETLQCQRYMMYSNEDRDIADAKLAIFNNDVLKKTSESVQSSLAELLKVKKDSLTNLRGEITSVLTITRSGAEGISTRNVRQVHVCESFWHANRVEQVIGRARRAHSHDELPKGERNVEVYIYIARFTKEQAKLHTRDEGKTSDEHVHEVSQRKRRLLKTIYEVMKRAAIDCVANHGEDCIS